MKNEARMAQQPAVHGRRFVRRQVVEHDVNREVCRDALIDRGKESYEVFGAVFLLAGRDRCWFTSTTPPSA
jgi:hypothetical protein